MFNDFVFILSVSLFDSFVTTQQIVLFILLLTTARPIRNSMCYLLGLISAYFVCGIVGYLALEQLNSFVANYVSFKGRMSDDYYYQMQILMGLIFSVIGILYFRSKKKSKKPDMENLLIARFGHMSGGMACAIGVVISVTGFPLSLPYIAALGKFALMKMTNAEVISAIGLYNVIYALPMITILVVYFLVGAARKEGIESALNDKASKLNVYLTCVMFVLLGLISIADALAYFLNGQPIILNRYF